MFENHMMRTFEARELEMRGRLDERRADLVPLLSRHDHGVLTRISRWIRSRFSRSAIPASRSAALLHP